MPFGDRLCEGVEPAFRIGEAVAQQNAVERIVIGAADGLERSVPCVFRIGLPGSGAETVLGDSELSDRGIRRGGVGKVLDMCVIRDHIRREEVDRGCGLLCGEVSCAVREFGIAHAPGKTIHQIVTAETVAVHIAVENHAAGQRVHSRSLPRLIEIDRAVQILETGPVALYQIPSAEQDRLSVGMEQRELIEQRHIAASAPLAALIASAPAAEEGGASGVRVDQIVGQTGP